MRAGKIEFAVKALIFKNGKYLALHKTKVEHDFYELPGGRMEFGETAEETLIREVAEETNYMIEPIRLLDTWNFVAEDYQITGIIYYCKIKDGSLKLSDEHDRHEWLEFNEDSINRMHEVYRIKMINWNADKWESE